MTKHLPEWIMQRYAKLWNKFNEKEFSRGEAERIVNKDTAISVVLSELRKAGWLEMSMDKTDARKTIYRLKKPETAINELIKEIVKK